MTKEKEVKQIVREMFQGRAQQFGEISKRILPLLEEAETEKELRSLLSAAEGCLWEFNMPTDGGGSTVTGYERETKLLRALVVALCRKSQV